MHDKPNCKTKDVAGWEYELIPGDEMFETRITTTQNDEKHIQCYQNWIINDDDDSGM